MSKIRICYHPQERKGKGGKRSGGQCTVSEWAFFCGFFYGDVVFQRQEPCVLFYGGAVDYLYLTDLGFL